MRLVVSVTKSQPKRTHSTSFPPELSTLSFFHSLPSPLQLQKSINLNLGYLCTEASLSAVLCYLGGILFRLLLLSHSPSYDTRRHKNSFSLEFLPSWTGDSVMFGNNESLWSSRRIYVDSEMSSEGNERPLEELTVDSTSSVSKVVNSVLPDFVRNDSESDVSSSSFLFQSDNPLLAPVNHRIYRLQPNGTESEVLHYGGLTKFLQVWLTLITCTLLVALTLVLINRTKYWCRLHSYKKCGRSKDIVELNSEVASTPSTSIIDETSQSNFNSSGAHKYKNGHSPREHFSRRPSGPFGDEVIAYADESYQFRTKPAPTDKIRYLTNFKLEK